jgi:hypothetical protein
MDLFDAPSVKAVGSSMTFYPNMGELSILIDILNLVLPTDVLRDVRDVRLEYVESFFTPERTFATRYRLTLRGGPVRCAVIQNLINAATQGDETRRQRFISIANQ